jgi:ArsR family transcriptional regulator, nickel/cobalt-responsive transcriptional repressor
MNTSSHVGSTLSDVGHRPDPTATRAPLDAATAKQVATTLQALATPSRLLILATLQGGPRAVGDLAETVGMGQSAVSHQLRLLRNLGLVEGERRGRHIEYRLYDDHVAELIEQAIYHAEHVRLGLPAVVADPL